MKQVTILRKKANRKHAKKELSIHEISPEWAILLGRLPKTDNHEYYIRGQKLDIQDCKYCVVGEAYGFDDSYQDWNGEKYCTECYHHSVDFGRALTDDPVMRGFMIDNFVDHWNKEHA